MEITAIINEHGAMSMQLICSLSFELPILFSAQCFSISTLSEFIFFEKMYKRNDPNGASARTQINQDMRGRTPQTEHIHKLSENKCQLID